MTDRELLQIALDALETVNNVGVSANWQRHFDGQIKALRDRLAQPEPEPAAYLWNDKLFFPHEYRAIARGGDAQPLFKGGSRV
jgi:hypothetical protein